MIKLYPSAELHLLRGQSVELELFMNHLGSNAWIRVNNPLALAPGVALATLSGRLLTASASAMGTNIDFLAIQDGQGNDILKVPVHVSVHDTVLRVMCSHARHEVEVTSSDRVLVVYAEFVDANGSVVVAEVTGSNLLHYDWSPADGLTVSADGRVEVSATPGTWTVTVTVDPAFGVTPTPTSASVIIHSVPAASEYPILVRHHEGTEVRRRALLFIAEGWTADMEGMFHDLCGLIAKRLMRVRPYRYLAESLDVYAAFTASAEEGITVGADAVVSPVHPDHAYVLMRDGSPLLEAVSTAGLPNEPGAPATLAALRAASNVSSLTQREFDIWSLIPQAQRTRVRDTAWGVAITYPQHGPYTHALSAGATKPSRPALSVLPRGPARAPYFADHRLPELRGASPQDPTTAHVARLYDFVGKLRTTDGPSGMGKRWQPDGDSAGMVVFLARSDLHGGIFLEGDMGCVIVTTGREADAGVSPSSIPGLQDVIAGRTSSLGDPETRRRRFDVLRARALGQRQEAPDGSLRFSAAPQAQETDRQRLPIFRTDARASRCAATRFLATRFLDRERRDDLLEVAVLPLQLELRGGLAATASQRLLDAAERVLAPAFDGARVDAKPAGDLVDGRLAGEQLQDRLLALLDGASAWPGSHVGLVVARRRAGVGAGRRWGDQALLVHTSGTSHAASSTTRTTGDFQFLEVSPSRRGTLYERYAAGHLGCRLTPSTSLAPSLRRCAFSTQEAALQRRRALQYHPLPQSHERCAHAAHH